MILRSNPNYYLSHSKPEVHLAQKKFSVKNPIWIKNAHFTDEIVF